MPDVFITLPIRMKSGAARSGNEFAAIAIFCGMTMPGMPVSARNANPARPIDAYNVGPKKIETNHAARIAVMSAVIAARRS